MSNLFSETWMKEFATFWNADKEIAQNLNGQRFNAKVGYGFLNANHPIGLLVILHGKVKDAELYRGQNLDWDLRADIEDWQSWLREGLGLARLGFVVAHEKLQFQTGDYRKILRTPRLATAFLRSFDLMSKVTTKFVVSPENILLKN
ncbi:SCP-2 sterol transfer family protein [Candidatus Parabeggiatoa sp. HSG14]|uniref:SCP-2 sterol transfer family protein n=1 Tax=Candidatus Parabeggiatoa sp. HSG14 TaxID=3055593 RepID=UPI0025A8E9E1|nr:SCP-2 sterol transfer family protein [Thiotrichales bacterium HSG14]